ncbi:MAG TPA: hypothetical protein VML75_06975 [Kofleriaceae bacterium]|nr:hypothetical protein [Kofleriaceae bacterium]
MRIEPLLLLVTLLVLAPGCNGDAVCGPGTAPADGLSADIGTAEVTFGGFTSSVNNDCTPPEGGPTSITVDGTQVGQPAFHITFCLPRPAQLGADPVAVTDVQRLEVIDINARLDENCLLILDRTRAGTGTVTFAGYCGDGLDPAGYAMEFDAVVPGTRICTGNQQEPVDIALTGSVAIDAI